MRMELGEPKCLELGSDKHRIVQGRDVIVELRRDVVHRLRDMNKIEYKDDRMTTD